jgi:hypothetical protein
MVPSYEFNVDTIGMFPLPHNVRKPRGLEARRSHSRHDGQIQGVRLRGRRYPARGRGSREGSRLRRTHDRAAKRSGRAPDVQNPAWGRGIEVQRAGSGGRKVSGDVDDQVGRIGRDHGNRASASRRHDCHIRCDGPGGSVQRGGAGLRRTRPPRAQESEWTAGDYGHVEGNACVVTGMPHGPAIIGKLRAVFAASAGPANVPVEIRVSARRHGAEPGAPEPV